MDIFHKNAKIHPILLIKAQNNAKLFIKEGVWAINQGEERM